MKSLKSFGLAALMLVSSSAFAQLKIVKFGVKGGMNLPQQTLSLNDINDIVNNQTYDISNIQTEFSDGFNAGLVARVSLPLVPVYVHGEALYTQFDESIAITDGTEDFTINSTILIEGGRILGYTYFYLATDGIDRSQLKKRMVHLEHDAYAAGIVHHFYSKGYLKLLEI